MRRCSWCVPAVRGANHFFCPDTLPCVQRCNWWFLAVRGANRFSQTHCLVCEDVAGGSQQSGGRIIFFARTHFLACKDVAGGSQQSGGESFFSQNTVACTVGPRYQVEENYFARNKEALSMVWHTQLSASPRIVHVRWKSFLDHVDHAAPRAPRRWMMARPRKGTTRSRGRRGSGCTRGEEYEGSLVRLRCRHHRITGGVGEWRDRLASGVSSRGR